MTQMAHHHDCRTPVEDVGGHARRGGHVAVKALGVGQQRRDVEQLREAVVRLRQRLHRLQQDVAPRVACEGAGPCW